MIKMVGCLPGTSEDNIALHQCRRSHRRNHVYQEGTTSGNKEGNTINAMQQYDA